MPSDPFPRGLVDTDTEDEDVMHEGQVEDPLGTRAQGVAPELCLKDRKRRLWSTQDGADLERCGRY